MAIDYDTFEPFGWTDPRMERPWRVVRSLMPACGAEGLTVRPEHLTFPVHFKTFVIFMELFCLRLEAELRRPISVGLHPDKVVFTFQEFV